MMNNFLKPFCLLLSMVLIAMPLIAEEKVIVAFTDRKSEFNGICQAVKEGQTDTLKFKLEHESCRDFDLRVSLIVSEGKPECLSIIKDLRRKNQALQVSFFYSGVETQQQEFPSLVVLPDTAATTSSYPPKSDCNISSYHPGDNEEKSNEEQKEVAYRVAYWATKILMRAVKDANLSLLPEQTATDSYKLSQWLATKVQIVQVPQAPLIIPKEDASFQPSKVAEQPFDILKKGDILIQLEGVKSYWVEVQQFPEGKKGWIHRGLLKKLPKEESK